MDEQAIVGARAAVMVYDDENKKWIPSGTSTGVSKVHIYQHMTQNTFRVVGRKLHDHELVINCAIVKNLKYNKATPTFHQWRDTKQVYGLNFSSKEDAENFANSMLKVLDVLNVPMIMNGNSTNNQMSQNIINKQAQQPVYGHLTETQQQLIKQQQYQAPPEYSENIHQNNRTNGWTNQQQAQVQNQISQPNSLDLNDWRQQQMQNDLNQLNLNGNLPVSMMNSMQPIYGHHRNSLPQQNSQQMQQNAQILNQQHQQLIQHQQNQQQINGLQQQMIPNLQQQSIQSPPQQQPNNLAQQIQSPQSIPQIAGQGLSQPSNQNNLSQIQSVSTQPSNIPVPPPPPPVMPANNAPPPPPMPTNLTLNKANQSGTNLSAALSNAKLKKTPNKDDTKEKQNVGGGMASMMDEMAKTLARRRAQAEGITSCNNDENDSGRLRNGWDNKNKSSPNKDNENSHSRLRTGSVDISNHLEQFDVEKLKQDIITEMKKEMNKIKLEIIEVIKSEMNKN